jgi:parallel beta-helix repeat protein
MKIKKINISFIFMISLFFANAFSSTYYLSNNGNDSNNGLSPDSPLKTISKLNSVVRELLPGDAVYFERGGYFTGQINISKSGTENNPIIFGAYGEGRNPIISGAVPVKGWVRYKENIFSADADTVIKNFFVNNKQMIIARYPNSGFLKIKKPFSNPKNGFSDAQLNQPKGYWNGSNVRMRTMNWAFEYSQVKNFSNGSISFSNPTFYPVNSGWGYYLDNNLNVLDTAGEWYYKEIQNSKGKVYIYPPDEIDVQNSFIEGSIYAYGFFSRQPLNNVIIQDLEIRNQFASGIGFTGINTEVEIINCTFSGQILNGINFSNRSDKCKIINCRFYDINSKGISLRNSFNTIVSRNIFKNIGMIPGYGVTGEAFGLTAIAIVSSDENVVTYNYINGTGHGGINNIGNSNLVEKNIIFNTMQLLNDGGAIKSYGLNSKNSVWKNNFIFDVKGNLAGASPEKNEITAEGIYLDEFSNNIKVIGNTIVRSGDAGINLYNKTNNNLFSGNICYDNKVGISFHDGTESMEGNLTTDNIFFGTKPGQFSVRLISSKGTFVPGTFDRNYYCNPTDKDLFRLTLSSRSADYDLSVWKRLTGKSDSHSKILTGPGLKYSGLYKNMSDDTLKVLLDPQYNYKDLSMNNIYGSIELLPWTSEILLTNSNVNKSAELEVAGGQINFENLYYGNYLSPQWYNLTGSKITAPVTVTAPEGFNVSLRDDINFSKTVTVYPVKGSVNAIIFVKFNPDEDKGYTGFVTNSINNIKSEVKVSGNSR